VLRGDGEERSEEIHCCECVRGMRDAMKLCEDQKVGQAHLLYKYRF
jgi:hypothetical protein